MQDPHATLRDEVFAQVFDGPGDSDPAVRAVAANNGGVPSDLEPLVRKIHARAYKVTDDDVSRLRGSYGDDRLFEIIVSTALGASRRRLIAGLTALDDATDV